MEFHFIRMKTNNGYVTVVDPKKKPRMMCFKNKVDAHKCVRHISYFRSKYGVWPNMDLSDPNTKIISPVKFKTRTPDQIAAYMDIETLYMDDLERLSLSANASLMYCYAFEALPEGDNFLSLSFSGQEIDLEVDEHMYRTKMDLHISRI